MADFRSCSLADDSVSVSSSFIKVSAWLALEIPLFDLCLGFSNLHSRLVLSDVQGSAHLYLHHRRCLIHQLLCH